MADDTKMAGRRKINEPARTGLTGKNTGNLGYQSTEEKSKTGKNKRKTEGN